MARQSRSSRVAAEQQLVAGIQQHLAQLPSVPVAGQTLAPADIVKLLQARIGTGQASIAADTARTAASKADDDEIEKTAVVVSALRKMLQAMFASAPGTLADFGLVPPKVTAPTAATKLAAVAKRQATRAARHTMGPKQKAAIHGSVASSPTAASPAVTAIKP